MGFDNNDDLRERDEGGTVIEIIDEREDMLGDTASLTGSSKNL